MLDFLMDHQKPVPSWLCKITARDVHDGPGRWMKRFLAEAIVYPGSGTDWSPMRHMAGVTHAFLFLDHGISQEQILEAVQSGFKDRDGCVAYRVHAWAEFNPTPFLADSTVQNPRPPADYQCNSYGVWAVLTRLDGGGRVVFMALGAEAIGAISSLFPVVPPKGLVVQEHSFDFNLWGCWQEPLNQYANAHWSEAPEWLILGHDRSRFSHRDSHYEALGEDRAFESSNRDWRVIFRNRGI